MSTGDPRHSNGPASDARKRRWRAHRQARRAAMLEAAISAIRRHGPHVGMDDIAAEAGVTKPVLYRHFADKNDLYTAVGRKVAEELLAVLTTKMDEERETRARVAAVVDTYLASIEAEPELYRFVVRRPILSHGGDDSDTDLAADYATLIARHLTRLIGETMRGLGVDSGCAEPWGHGLVGMVQAAGDWWLEERSMSRASLTEYLTTLIWGGFAGVFAIPSPSSKSSPNPPAPAGTGSADSSAGLRVVPTDRAQPG